MITIIKNGKIKHEHTCPNCDCVFRFEPEDVTRRTVWDDHGGHYPVTDFFELNCPFCKNKIDVGNVFNSQEKEKMKHINE